MRNQAVDFVHHAILDEIEAVIDIQRQPMPRQERLPQRRLHRREAQPASRIPGDRKPHPAVAKIADAVEQHNRTASSGARDVRIVAPHHAVMTSRKTWR